MRGYQGVACDHAGGDHKSPQGRGPDIYGREIEKYILDIVFATREPKNISLMR
jgi:hypothetical protein